MNSLVPEDYDLAPVLKAGNKQKSKQSRIVIIIIIMINYSLF